MWIRFFFVDYSAVLYRIGCIIHNPMHTRIETAERQKRQNSTEAPAVFHNVPFFYFASSPTVTNSIPASSSSGINAAIASAVVFPPSGPTCPIATALPFFPAISAAFRRFAFTCSTFFVLSRKTSRSCPPSSYCPQKSSPFPQARPSPLKGSVHPP